MFILIRNLKLLSVLSVLVLSGCGTFRPEYATLRPLQGENGYELEIETTQRNELNFHTFRFDTYKHKHILDLASKGPVIDGSQITIHPWVKMPHPTGTIQIQGDSLKIELQAPFWDSEHKIYRFSEFPLNGVYKLRSVTGKPSPVSD